MATTLCVNLNPTRLCPDLTPAGLARGQQRAFEVLDDLGVGGIRVDLVWSALEPAAGQVDEAVVRWYEGFLAEAAQRGLKVYALLYHPPAWAMAKLAQDEAGFLDAWRGFCRLVAERFGRHLAIAQVWNEPNNFLAALKGDAALFRTRRVGPLALPVGVPWALLASLFRVARAELPAGLPTAFNPLANLLPFLPVAGSWLDWEPFTDRLLALAGDAIDVIAIDHYPDTWHPGTGPLEWSCLETATRKARDPRSPWFGKAVIVGEVGYSSTPNFHLIERPFKLGRFFPEAERDESTMAAWYAAAIPCVQGLLAPFEAQPLGAWLNLYELFDPSRPCGGHPALAIEDHFGLVRRDGTPKPAYAVVQALARGEAVRSPSLEPRRAPLYWRLGGWARRVVGQALAALPASPLVLPQGVKVTR